MSYGLPRDGKAPNSPQFTDESTGEPVYSLGDRFLYRMMHGFNWHKQMGKNLKKLSYQPEIS